MSQSGGLHQSNPRLCPPVRLLLCAWVFDVSGDGKVLVYGNMPEKLRSELSRRRTLPAYVFFSPTCDVMQPIPQVLKVTYELMSILFERGVGVNLLTKGRIHPQFLPLFRQYKQLVHVQIGITALNQDIQKSWNPSPQPRRNASKT